MIDEVPNILKHECPPQAGHFSHFNLWSWVVNVVAPDTRNNGIARDTFPSYRTTERDSVVEQQRQIACLGQRTGARATFIKPAPVLVHVPFLGAAANCQQRVFFRDFESA